MDTLALPFVPQRSKTPDVITVYHGCGLSKVADIVAHIVLEIPPKPKATDFSAKSEQRSFYTTKSEKFARGWAESKAIKEVPAVIKFELKVGDLNVYDFGEETQGGNFERWQKVIILRLSACCVGQIGLIARSSLSGQITWMSLQIIDHSAVLTSLWASCLMRTSLAGRPTPDVSSRTEDRKSPRSDKQHQSTRFSHTSSSNTSS
jgi:hypothetical protein